MFTFQHEADLNLVFRRRPWTLRGSHLNLKVWNPELNWNEVDFSVSTFWIQVHGLPSLWQNKSNLLRIGNKVGKVLEVDFSGEAHSRWYRFVRIRVEVDISVPLKPGMFLPRNELDDVWIGLKYEKMPDFCYKCGLIRHEANGCYSAASYISNQFDHKFPAFGPWLRSDNEDRPPGIYDKPVDPVAEPITPRVNTPVNLAVVPHPLPGVVGAHDHLAKDKGCRFTCQTSSGRVAVRPVPHDSVVPQLMPEEHNSLQVRNNILSRGEDSTEQVGFVSSSPQPDNSPVLSPLSVISFLQVMGCMVVWT